MIITPFEYAVQAHVFTIKNVYNIIKLCFVYIVISMILHFLGFINLNVTSNVDNSTTLSIIISVVIELVLPVMYTVPYLQYAYIKHKDFESSVFPTIKMTITWDIYKIRYLIGYLKISAIFALICMILMLIAIALGSIVHAESPIWIIVAVWGGFIICVLWFLIITAMRLKMVLVAIALGENVSITYIWGITKKYKWKLFLLFLSNILFFILWLIPLIFLIIYNTLFLGNLYSKWDDFIYVFVYLMTYCMMWLAVTHSLMLFYSALNDNI